MISYSALNTCTRARITGAVSFLALIASVPALAQQTPEAETVVVTGSRISLPGFESPTPVTSLGSQTLQLLAPANVEELETDLPALEPTQNSFAAGGAASSNFDLRGLGATRTLFLVDGRRMPGTATDGTTDVSILPTNLIQHIDVITGGASAAYGSDAVAGVVEVSLDNKFTGIKAQAQAGESAYNDYQNYDLSGAYGTAFGPGDRGHIVLSADMYGNEGARDQGNRPWANTKVGLLTNPNYAPGNGQSQLLIVPNTTFSHMTAGGLIDAPASSPLYGIMFGPGGSIEHFQYGSSVGTTFQVGGDPANSFSPWVDLFPTESRMSGYGHASYDITNDISAYVDVVYAREYSHMTIVPNYNNGNITITSQNAFLPAQISSIMAANNITSFLLGRSNIDLGYDNGLGNNYATTNTGRYAAGLNGQLGSDWQWEAYAQYGVTRSDFSFGNSLNVDNWADAIDSVISPTTGQPVCRSNLTGGNPACVPVNLFGPNTISQAVNNYVLGTAWNDETIAQSDFAADIQGKAFQDWAGDVTVASGVEYRRNTAAGVSDPTSVAAEWRLVNSAALNGSDSVTEGYLETAVPLAKDLPWAESAELDAAGRVTDYSTSGTVETWKLGLNYQPLDDLRLRGVWSHDIRAPNLSELYSAQAYGIFVVNDPFTQTQPTVHVESGGNPNLVPEEANNLTGGVVYQPSWLPNFQASVDYYKINITGAIGSVAAQNVITNCYAGQTSFCSQITRGSNGDITSVFAALVNYSELKTDGFDIDAAYSMPMSDIMDDWGGDLSLHLVGNYVGDLINVASGVAIQYAGAVAGNATGVPHWRANLTAQYTNNAISFQAMGRWVGGGVQSNTYIQGAPSVIPSGYETINNNQVDGRLYIDIAGSYQLANGIQPYFRIANLFNVSPPLTPSTVIGDQQAASTYYDVIGRVYAVGVRFATN